MPFLGEFLKVLQSFPCLTFVGGEHGVERISRAWFGSAAPESCSGISEEFIHTCCGSERASGPPAVEPNSSTAEP